MKQIEMSDVQRLLYSMPMRITLDILHKSHWKFVAIHSWRNHCFFEIFTERRDGFIEVYEYITCWLVFFAVVHFILVWVIRLTIANLHWCESIFEIWLCR